MQRIKKAPQIMRRPSPKRKESEPGTPKPSSLSYPSLSQNPCLLTVPSLSSASSTRKNLANVFPRSIGESPGSNLRLAPYRRTNRAWSTRAETTLPMRIVETVSAMQRLAVSWRRRGVRVGFVPTMGYLHAGHVSLVQRARQLVGTKGLVIVSIYVNPAQFAPTEDLSRYPRDFQRDRRLCRMSSFWRSRRPD